ncbi:MAG TPA: LamG-like jellyroll fold domain-containing protein [Verrucomicrobiae bacterium]|nr:LamG-like jellyroll fold domain-containing protein [Verrucomicrobiae bacterium]
MPASFRIGNQFGVGIGAPPALPATALLYVGYINAAGRETITHRYDADTRAFTTVNDTHVVVEVLEHRSTIAMDDREIFDLRGTIEYFRQLKIGEVVDSFFATGPRLVFYRKAGATAERMAVFAADGRVWARSWVVDSSILDDAPNNDEFQFALGDDVLVIIGSDGIRTGYAVAELTQVISPDGLASAAAFGVATVQLNLSVIQPSGISAGSVGTPSLVNLIAPTGIASAAAFGTPSVIKDIIPTGIASVNAFGTLKLTFYIQPTSISDGAVGTPSVLKQIISPTGIASAQAVGTPNVAIQQFISPSGIASAGASGTHTVIRGPVFINPSGIASAGAFGTAQLNLQILPSSVTSGESVGSPLVFGGQAISPTGIATGQAFGTALLTLQLLPTGIASAEAFGTTTVSASTLGLGLTLLWKLGEASGTRVATVGGLDLTESGGVGQNTGPSNLGNAAAFDSNDDYLYHADDGALREGDFDSHWVAWVYVTVGSTRMVVGKDVSGDRGQIAFHVNQVFQLEGPDSGGTDRLIAYGSSFTANAWHMVDWGYDKSAGKWFVNVDAGTRVDTSQSHPKTGQTAQFRIGARAFSGFENYFGGRICYVMRWDRILSGSELTQLYNSGNGLAHPFA